MWYYVTHVTRQHVSKTRIYRRLTKSTRQAMNLWILTFVNIIKHIYELVSYLLTDPRGVFSFHLISYIQNYCRITSAKEPFFKGKSLIVPKCNAMKEDSLVRYVMRDRDERLQKDVRVFLIECEWVRAYVARAYACSCLYCASVSFASCRCIHYLHLRPSLRYPRLHSHPRRRRWFPRSNPRECRHKPSASPPGAHAETSTEKCAL